MTRSDSEVKKRPWVLMSDEQAALLPWYKRWVRWVYFNERYAELRKYPKLADLPREIAKRWIVQIRREAIRKLPLKWRLIRYAPFLLLCAFLYVHLMLYTIEPALQSTPDLLITARINFGLGSNLVGLTAVFFVAIYRFYQIRQTNRMLEMQLYEGRFHTCLHCQYDLQGSTRDSCPECDTPVTLDIWREANT